MSPPGTFSIRSALATPSKVMVGMTIISPCPGETDSVTFIRVGLPDARIKADAKPPLRLRIGRVLRPIGEELAERALAGGNDEQVEAGNQREQIALLNPAAFDFAAAIHEVLHQRRKIDPVIDGAARPGKVAAEADRLREVEEVVVVIIVIAGLAPVIDPEIVLTRNRHMMVCDRVQQAGVAVVLWRAVGNERGGDAVFLQIKRKMQAGNSCADEFLCGVPRLPP